MQILAAWGSVSDIVSAICAVIALLAGAWSWRSAIKSGKAAALSEDAKVRALSSAAESQSRIAEANRTTSEALSIIARLEMQKKKPLFAIIRFGPTFGFGSHNKSNGFDVRVHNMSAFTIRLEAVGFMDENDTITLYTKLSCAPGLPIDVLAHSTANFIYHDSPPESKGARFFVQSDTGTTAVYPVDGTES